MNKEWLVKTLAFSIAVLFFITTVSSSIGFSNYPDDTTPPVTTISTNPPEPVGNGWYNVPVGVTLNATDNESGINVTYYRINNGDWFIYTHTIELQECGIIIIQFYSIDNAGNVEDTKQVEIKIDCYPPTTYCFFDPSVPNGLCGWYVSNVTVTLNAIDNESGVNRTYCNLLPPGEVFTEPINISEDGIYNIVFESIDNVGNTECMKSVTLKIDKTPPNGTLEWVIHRIGCFKWKIIFYVNISEDLSGIDKIEFYLNDYLQDTISGPGPIYGWVFTFYYKEEWALKIVVWDSAGNNATFIINLSDIHPHNRINFISHYPDYLWILRFFEIFPFFQRWL